MAAGGASAAKGISTLGTAGKVSQVTRLKLVSRIKENNTLVKHARAAGKAYQKDIDHLIERISQGNFQAGSGGHPIKTCRGVFEARAKSGARVYFRREGDIIEIMAKSGKGNQNEVIRLLRRLYQK